MAVLEVVLVVLEVVLSVVLARVIQGAMVNATDVRHAVEDAKIAVALVPQRVARHVVKVVVVHAVVVHVGPDVPDRVLTHVEPVAHQNRLL